jgi:hypothetical protein
MGQHQESGIRSICGLPVLEYPVICITPYIFLQIRGSVSFFLLNICLLQIADYYAQAGKLKLRDPGGRNVGPLSSFPN